jgi:hypothetical protein
VTDAKLSLTDYQRAAERTMTLDPERFGHLIAVFALGLAGESGEVVEMVKKHIGLRHAVEGERRRQSHPLPRRERFFRRASAVPPE